MGWIQDPESENRIMKSGIRDPKKTYPGSGSRVKTALDPGRESATLMHTKDVSNVLI